MNTKNRTYMQNSEFKERQSSFQFFCAQAFEFLVQFKNECIAGWKKLFKPGEKFINLTMKLPFDLFVVYSYEERKQA